jgi:hypothetical protein
MHQGSLWCKPELNHQLAQMYHKVSIAKLEYREATAQAIISLLRDTENLFKNNQFWLCLR